jgi:PAS domain S-box-containing protein
VTSDRDREVGLGRLMGETADGVCAMDAGGRVLSGNPAAERLLGQPAVALAGRPCWEVFLGRDGAGTSLCHPGCHVMAEVQRGAPVPHFEMVSLARPGAPAWLDVSTLVYRGARPEPTVIVHLFRELPGGRAIEAGAGERVAETPRSDPSGPQRPAMLTRREAEVLRLIAGGAGTRVIATALGIRVATVRNHVQNLFGKLGVRSRLEAAAYATRNGLADWGGSPGPSA